MNTTHIDAVGLLHACRWCGYDERIGDHGVFGPADRPDSCVMTCCVPANATPVAFVRVTLQPPDIGPDVPGGGAA